MIAHRKSGVWVDGWHADHSRKLRSRKGTKRPRRLATGAANASEPLDVEIDEHVGSARSWAAFAGRAAEGLLKRRLSPRIASPCGSIGSTHFALLRVR